ncbi:MAG: site-2 protease family protein [Clostridia bacterium]|nr:site-2 protease family protein [Clostridia bacterium]
MFFSFDKRILYIILGICVLSMFMGYLSNPAELLSLLLSIPGVLIAITFHEYAHAYAAYKLGDDTAKLQGRLTLNPLKHMDPIGIVMLVFLGYGWGKSVQIDSRNFNRNISVSKAEAIVSIAGPIANFILAIVFSIITVLVIKFDLLAACSVRAALTIMTVLQSIIVINVGLGLFNLIPLPPLDGSKVLNHFLPYNAQMWFKNNEQIFYIIFLVMWITRIAGTLILPARQAVYSGILRLTATIFGVSI